MSRLVPRRENWRSCKTAQELDLGEEAQLSDFIQEDGAFPGLLEIALARPDRPGEGSFLVAEQLGLDQSFRDCAAGHSYKRAAGASAEVVNGTSNKFLTRSALAGDQHGDVNVRHGADRLINFQHLRAGTDHAVTTRGRLHLGQRRWERPLD